MVEFDVQEHDLCIEQLKITIHDPDENLQSFARK